ncbi:MAG: CDP-diacylglycerol--serine O-phosphatidyltransferase [Parabacteroides distasonis]|nr:CDP-diacylglycerol--serine O-phosphatidyltransferase [Parabacteroides distasonis]MBR2496961.1 CDP-diacylglycerol--serine O-phosphatidyltransferase [Parabacteroides sp.]
MSVKKNIPNLVTCCSLLSGCIATIMALDCQLSMAALWIIIASVFDFGDGFAARSLQAYSPMGKELDSLSDMVSFGVAPGMIVYRLLEQACMTISSLGSVVDYIPFFALVIPVFSALRLAKFNIDERQTTSFIGMPVPAHALFWASIGYTFQTSIPQDSIGFVVGIVVAAILLSWLLVSEIPMFSLKVKSLKWKGNELRYILVGGAVLFVVLFGVLGIAGTIILYIALSFFNRGR